jgi:hypothetical protein
VVLLRGGRQATGPRAAVIAGEIYGQLAQLNYFSGPSDVRSGAPHNPPQVVGGFILAGVLILLCSLAIISLVWRKLRV